MAVSLSWFAFPAGGALLQAIPALHSWYEAEGRPEATEAAQEIVQSFFEDDAKVEVFRDRMPFAWEGKLTRMTMLQKLTSLIWLALAVAQRYRGEVVLQSEIAIEAKLRRELEELEEAVEGGTRIYVVEEAVDCLYYCIQCLAQTGLWRRRKWLKRLLKVLKTVQAAGLLNTLMVAGVAKYRLRVYKKDKPREHEAVSQATEIPLD